MNEKEKDLSTETPDNSESCENSGINPDKTTADSPIPESVADEAVLEPEAVDAVKNEKEKPKRKLESEIKRLKSEAEKLNETLDCEKERYIRLYAEYDNYRKRSASEKQGVYADAYSDVLREMLPVYDTLERALAVSTETTEAAKLLEGMKLTLNMFSESFCKLGIERFGKPGDKFDPILHNAIMHEESDEHGDGVISEVFQPGFKKGDRVLRFAMVKVAN